ncbi:hypothetical protein [Mucilaginibacter gilvus]|uniref:Uncharacterized protein n=1 Tax=Mucilaginibacter gilvus TaxID=2305909 RepID=A0A3S3VDF5_9SPHI|nr:hypothetical protein [Mucilaginibacter gilvus]RWY50996.1 hypothetical protein EPL05_13065 [Mucilaginibacter gilvus]
MELQELQTIWAEYDRKLDRNLHLNMQLLRQIKLDKAGSKLSSLFYYKITEMIILAAAVIYLGSFVSDNWGKPQFSLSAIAICALFVVCFVYDVKQLSLIRQVQRGFNAAIAPLQKKIEQLKLSIVTCVKCALILLPLYPLLLLLAGKMVFNVDFLEPARRTYFLSNAAVAIILIPLAVWLIAKLSAKNINNSVAKTLLMGSGWYQANAAYRFLGEIEKFEQEA